MIEKILDRLDKVKKRGSQGYMARCPSHDDRSPSLAITELSDGRVLIKCFAGCGASEVLSAIGLELSDLYPDGRIGEFRSFMSIERDINKKIEQKKENKLFKERMVLDLAEEDRKNGKRLNPQDLERERLAFERLRNANSK